MSTDDNSYGHSTVHVDLPKCTVCSTWSLERVFLLANVFRNLARRCRLGWNPFFRFLIRYSFSFFSCLFTFLDSHQSFVAISVPSSSFVRIFTRDWIRWSLSFLVFSFHFDVLVCRTEILSPPLTHEGVVDLPGKTRTRLQ